MQVNENNIEINCSSSEIIVRRNSESGWFNFS